MHAGACKLLAAANASVNCDSHLLLLLLLGRYFGELMGNPMHAEALARSSSI
jgi:hypothetical protein